MPNSLDQLRAANPVPDAALSDVSRDHSERTLARITRPRSTWTVAAAAILTLALVGGVVPLLNHSEPVASAAEILTQAGESAAARPDAADKGVTAKEYMKRVDTLGDATAVTEYSVDAGGAVQVTSQGEVPGFDPQPTVNPEDLVIATDRAGLDRLADSFPNRALGALELLLQPGLSSEQQKIAYDMLAEAEGNEVGTVDGEGEDQLVTVLRDADHVSFSVLPATGQLVRVVGLVGPGVETTIDATAILDCVSVTGLEGPDRISLACGDNNYLVNQLEWSNWGADAAEAEGQAIENNCDPNCAEGEFSEEKVKVVVDKRMACGYNTEVYSRVRVQYPDGREEEQPIGCAP